MSDQRFTNVLVSAKEYYYVVLLSRYTFACEFGGGINELQIQLQILFSALAGLCMGFDLRRLLGRNE